MLGDGVMMTPSMQMKLLLPSSKLVKSCDGREGDTSLYPHLIGCLKCVFLLCNMGKYASSSLLQDWAVEVSVEGEGK